MAIYRLSIECLQGNREGDDNKSHALAVDALKTLQKAVRGVPGIVLYDEGTTEAWGVPMRPDTFNLDFDSENTADTDVDALCLDVVADFMLLRS